MTGRAAATRYARAIFDVAKKEADIHQAGRELTEFAALVAGHETLARVLANPSIPAARKRAVIEQLLAAAGTVSMVVAKVLLLLADRDRLALVADIARAYQDRLMEHANIVRGELVTAVPLSADRIAKVQQGLSAATGRTIQLQARTDPSIIGGAITRIASTVYDGSVTRQLEKMKDALIEGSR